MTSEVRFEKRSTRDIKTNRQRGEVVVIRNGREVAVLPEAGRLDRTLSLPFDEAAWIARNFHAIMHREATPAEREFWRAVIECKRGQAHLDTGIA